MDSERWVSMAMKIEVHEEVLPESMRPAGLEVERSPEQKDLNVFIRYPRTFAQ
jgi:hypothetical protein